MPQDKKFTGNFSALSTPQEERMTQIEALRYFLATAPASMMESEKTMSQYRLPNGEQITCVLWNELFHITSTDILRALVYRFEAFGRPVTNLKKFEEGVFSDMRHLRPGHDAVLEETRSEFLELLHKNNCIRTLKKQKVYYWFSVPHDRLFLDALERDIRRERKGMTPTSTAVSEPAITISADVTDNAFFELRSSLLGNESEDSSTGTGTGTDTGLAGGGGASEAFDHSATPAPTEPDQCTPDERSTPVKPRSYSSTPGLDPEAYGQAEPNRNQRFSIDAVPSVASDLGSRVWARWDRAASLDHISPHLLPSQWDPTSGAAHSPFSMSAGRCHTSTPEPFPFGMYPSSRRVAGSEPPGNPEEWMMAAVMGKHFMPMPTSRQGTPSTDDFAEPRPFVCPYPGCVRQFKRHQHWKRHIRSHTNIRPYECPLCGKTFTRSDSLTVHKRTHAKHLESSMASSAAAQTMYSSDMWRKRSAHFSPYSHPFAHYPKQLLHHFQHHRSHYNRHETRSFSPFLLEGYNYQSPRGSDVGMDLIEETELGSEEVEGEPTLAWSKLEDELASSPMSVSYNANNDDGYEALFGDLASAHLLSNSEVSNYPGI
ncbi:uncharacterized protein VTP21DRAFT_7970 [Calcarisporiella thermophila]|uniref:uncharacterized protein n=1 Tax=Calcarisporiella thermophila TaxID=911321 RepID=UPI00374271CA